MQKLTALVVANSSYPNVGRQVCAGLGAAGWETIDFPAESKIDVRELREVVKRVRAAVLLTDRLDSSSLVDTPVSVAATEARQAGVPCHAIMGSCSLDDFGLRMLDFQHIVEIPAGKSGMTVRVRSTARKLGRELLAEMG